MSDFIINGGRPLRGKISVSGSKNAVLPIIFASLTVNGVSIIENVPSISDVDTALFLINELGAGIVRDGSTLTIDTRSLTYKPPCQTACSAIRASTYLMGAELARFGKTEIAAFGGCSFEPRPIDLHIYAAECMGAQLIGRRLCLTAPISGEIHFKKVSVGATANALIMAASLPVLTQIYGYAREPHIKALADFLSSAGAKIDFTHDSIKIIGTKLHGTHAVIPPDPIETGTFALLSLVSGGEIRVNGSGQGELSALIKPLSSAGASVICDSDGFSLGGALHSAVELTAAPYPALATDLQPLCLAALAFYKGGAVYDTVFPDRFGYIEELRRFGLEAVRTESGARVFPSKYHAANAKALDLRGGAALLFPALLSDGVSVISSAELIKRGYGGLIEKLRLLGAKIDERKIKI